MLAITRRIGESFFIGDDVKISIVSVQGRQVKIAIDAPRDVPILREELKDSYGNKKV